MTAGLVDVILNPSASLSEESESDKIDLSMSDRINSSEEPGGVGLPMTGAAEPATTVTFIRPVRIADITLLTTNGDNTVRSVRQPTLTLSDSDPSESLSKGRTIQTHQF